MASPYLVAAVSMSTLIALAAISATSSNQMNWSLTAQQAMNIQADKAGEDLSLTIKNNTLTVQNNIMNPSILKEFRIMDDAGNQITKIDYSSSQNSGYVLGAFDKTVLRHENFSMSDFTNKKIVAITDLGNVFAALNLDDLSNQDVNGNGKAMINGMGLNSRIIQFEQTGKINYGQGIVGTQESLDPYTSVPSTTNFAAEILDSATVTSIIIPKFNTKYEYDSASQTIHDIGAASPNILGFSASRTVGGGGSVTQGSEGITITGMGRIIVKLNDYAGQNLILEGNVPEAASLQLGSDLQYDYISILYHDTYGFKIYSGGLPGYSYSQNGCSSTVTKGYNCNASFTYTQTFSPPLVVSTPNNFVSYYGSNQFSINNGIQNPTAYSVNSITHVAGASSGWHAFCCQYPTSSPVPSGGELTAFDKETIMNNKMDLTSSFQMPYQFTTKQYYVIAQPNGGTITIRGVIFNPDSTPMLEIENLPPNTPFQIEKNGKMGASGMTNYDGSIVISASQFQINDVSIGGTLRLYPDSLAYRGPFSTAVFDNVNDQAIHIPTTDDKVYVVHAYVQIPVVGDIQVTDTYLDSQLALPYINGNYTTGNSIKIPVIPGYHDINMKINGIPTTTVIANVLGGSGLKVIEPNSSTVTYYTESNIVSSIAATAGSTSYVIATSGGTLTTSLTATISGDSEIENYAYFGSPPPPPLPPPPRDPLRAYVDVYKNGVLSQQQQIYFNANPIIQNTGETSGSSSSVTAKYSYPQTVVNGIITTNILPGDMVEFYLYADIQADGPIPTIPSGHIFYHYSGDGHATATIHSGSILTS